MVFYILWNIILQNISYSNCCFWNQEDISFLVHAILVHKRHVSKYEIFLWLAVKWDLYPELLFVFRRQECSIKAGVCESAINHHKFLKMSETKMLGNFPWKISVKVKLQVYTNFSLKKQLVQRYFWSIYVRVKVS